MENRFDKEQKYLLAKKKVEQIAKFYRHLSVYLVVNTILSTLFIYNDINSGDTFNEAFFNFGNFKIWFFWGIGVLVQAIGTFGLPFVFNKDWEERKLKQYLEEENRKIK